MKQALLTVVIPLAFSTSALAQMAEPIRAPGHNCSQLIQGSLDESDARLTGTNAPYEYYVVTATRGERVEFQVESTDFDSEIAFFQIDESGTFTMLESKETSTKWNWLQAWIYEDGEYAVRVASVDSWNTGAPVAFGNYTLQLYPVVCPEN